MAFTGGAEVQELVAVLRLKDQFSGTASRVQKSLGSLDKSFGSVQTRAFKAGQQIGTGIKNGAYIAAGALGFLAINVAKGLDSLKNLEDSIAQTNAVLKSTKSTAGQTSESIRDLAEKYESLNATIDDRVIQSGENLLLTFTNIRKEAFEPALAVALDMNQALGRGEGGLTSTIQQVGKALNDPIKGLTALQRVGITFTKVQRDQIKAAVEAGDTFKAQGIILAELNKRFGGSFLAGGSTTTGKVAKFKDAIEDLQRTLATALLPVIGKVADALSKFLNDPAVVKGAKDIGDAIAGLFSDENLRTGGQFLKEAFETAKAAAPVVAAAAKATFSLVQAAVGLFRSLPKEVQQLAIGAFAINKITGGLVTNLAGGLISSVLKQLVSGVVNVQGGVVNVGGAIGGAGGAAGATSKIGKVASAVAKVFLVGAAVGVFAELAGILGEQSKANKDLIASEQRRTEAFTGGASLADLQRGLDNINAQQKSLEGDWGLEGFAYRLNIDGVKDAVQHQEDVLLAEIAKQNGLLGLGGPIAAAVDAAAQAAQRTETAENRTAAAVNATRTRLAAEMGRSGRLVGSAVRSTSARQVAGIARVRAGIDGHRRATTAGAARTAAASARAGVAARAGGLAAAAAIRAKKLSVTVNNSLTQTVSIRDQIRREHQIARTTFAAS